MKGFALLFSKIIPVMTVLAVIMLFFPLPTLLLELLIVLNFSFALMLLIVVCTNKAKVIPFYPVGTLLRGESVMQSIYSSLPFTIGNGIFCILPAFLVSMAMGIIVTRQARGC